MKYDFTLTSEQQALVEDNLSVIGKTINLFIHPDEEVEGLGQDDFTRREPSRCAKRRYSGVARLGVDRQSSTEDSEGY